MTAGELVAAYRGGPSALLVDFNPARQLTVASDPERAHFGRAPALGAVARAFGPGTARTWVSAQVFDLMEFAGCREKLNPVRTEELAAMVIHDYGHLKLTELMMFFHQFKRGDYGRFYGAVDPMTILQGLAAYERERRRAYEEHRARQERDRARRDNSVNEPMQRRYAERVPGAYTPDAPVTFTQYLLLGYDELSPEELHAELEAISSGERLLPDDAATLLTFTRPPGGEN